jgi:hypothetical protein
MIGLQEPASLALLSLLVLSHFRSMELIILILAGSYGYIAHHKSFYIKRLKPVSSPHASFRVIEGPVPH